MKVIIELNLRCVSGAIADGMAFGVGSSMMHRAMDSVMGPRQMEVVHTNEGGPDAAGGGAAPPGGDASGGGEGGGSWFGEEGGWFSEDSGGGDGGSWFGD